MADLADQIRREAALSARPGQMSRLDRWANQADELRAERDRLHDLAYDQHGDLYRDRFRSQMAAAGELIDQLRAAQADRDRARDLAAGLEAESARLTQERDEARAGAKVLGETLHHVNGLVVEATGTQDSLDANSDGDWDGIYDRLHELGVERERLVSVVERVRAVCSDYLDRAPIAEECTEDDGRYCHDDARRAVADRIRRALDGGA